MCEFEFFSNLVLVKTSFWTGQTFRTGPHVGIMEDEGPQVHKCCENPMLIICISNDACTIWLTSAKTRVLTF